ncbi:hypothetical protein ABZ806_18120 [Spirillospora sp. NPDC047418]|jgi:hypothetical protein
MLIIEGRRKIIQIVTAMTPISMSAVTTPHSKPDRDTRRRRRATIKNHC